MAGSIKPKRHRIFIIPTAFGAIAGTIITLIMIYASANNASAALTLCVILLLAGMLAIFQTNVGVANIELSVLAIDDVVEGGKVPVHILIENRSRSTKYMLAVGVNSGFWQHPTSTTFVEKIAGKASIEIQIELPAKSRGVYALPDFKILSTFPLGICRAWTSFPLEKKFYVYPTPQGETQTTVTGRLDAHSSQLSADSSDFQGHRSYVVGDNLSYVDWKIHARGRGLQVKQYTQDTVAGRHFRYEDAPGESLEQKLKQLSKWVHDSHENNEPFSLELNHRTLNMGQGITHCRNALRMLAEVKV